MKNIIISWEIDVYKKRMFVGDVGVIPKRESRAKMMNKFFFKRVGISNFQMQL
ncbi:hypothetical protein V2H21_08700 [Riemerella anatipestifer]|uniref:hypothetical protein n=1 Tax=Riemerella anatipestifer TaxID=34085 RepID=UPI002EA6CD99|nr:hypothetical protein [Riemerella anatipestifer]